MSGLAHLVRAELIGERYRVIRPIGRGGCGAVYEVIDTVTDRVRALKLVDGPIDADSKARFRCEATIAGRAESAHLVEILDAGCDQRADVHYLVMERLRGEDLGSLLAREGRLESAGALKILTQVAAGLTALHREGIVHRDIKPQNVFLVGDGGARAHVKIVDFGIAKRFFTSTAVPKTTRAVGSPLYMAPEQLRGDGAIDHRADIYAFAHLAFVVLTGRPYYAPESATARNLYALLLRVAEGPVERASVRARAQGTELSGPFDEWFSKAAHAEPLARFDSVTDAASALATALGRVPARSLADPRRRPSSRVASRVRRTPLLATIALAALAFTFLGQPNAASTPPVAHEAVVAAEQPVPAATVATVSASPGVVAEPPSSAARVGGSVGKTRPPSPPARAAVVTTTRHDPLDSL